MFPESFAEKWIERLTKPGDIVFDPFCGRGTAPFQALLMKRAAVGCDINPVAYCVTKAKTNAPNISSVKRRLTMLERNIEPDDWRDECRRLPEFFKHAYHPSTLLQVLYLRDRLRWIESDVDCMIAALVLGALHGESRKSKSYLSNQMPRTISTKPDYSIRFWKKREYKAPKRDAFDLLRNRMHFRYASEPPEDRALVFQLDMRDLPRIITRLPSSIRCVITSPPYLDVTNVEEDQWLRLWFLGGPPKPTYRVVSRDDRHLRPDAYWNLISDIWRMLGQVLDSKTDIVIRMGGKNLEAEQIVGGLTATSIFSKRKVRLLHKEESEIKRRQTHVFRPGSKGCSFEVDCHFRME